MLKIGTAGIPGSVSGTINGVERISEIGLGAMEIEFVRGVYMKSDLAKKLKKVAKKKNVSLTVHAPYYINLNSNVDSKKKASIARIMRAAKMGDLAGAESVTFHAAYYMKQDASSVYETVKESLLKISKELKEAGIKIRISPEVTGKHSAFGDLDELLSLSKETGCGFCVDFAHLHARSNGGFNSKKDFDAVFEKIKEVVGAEALKNMHMHVSGINYGEKGEKNHLMLKNSDFNIRALVSSLKSYKIEGILICESPNPEKDALYIKSLF